MWNAPPDFLIDAARWSGVIFHLAPEGDVFTLEWRGPVDPLISEAIRTNYEAILNLLRREAAELRPAAPPEQRRSGNGSDPSGGPEHNAPELGPSIRQPTPNP